jgi:hypothetical protein
VDLRVIRPKRSGALQPVTLGDRVKDERARVLEISKLPGVLNGAFMSSPALPIPKTTIMSLSVQWPHSVPFTPLQTYPSVVVPISDFFNNQAASKGGYLGDFDGQKSSYDAQYLPNGSWVYDGITVLKSSMSPIFHTYIQSSMIYRPFGDCVQTIWWPRTKLSNCLCPCKSMNCISCMQEMDMEVNY